MAKSPTEREFNAAMRDRLKRAREDAGLTQGTMAQKLGVTAEAYAKYENRSVLPPHLIPRVCEILGTDPWFLLTGRFRSGLPFGERVSARSKAAKVI